MITHSLSVSVSISLSLACLRARALRLISLISVFLLSTTARLAVAAQDARRPHQDDASEAKLMMEGRTHPSPCRLLESPRVSAMCLQSIASPSPHSEHTHKRTLHACTYTTRTLHARTLHAHTHTHTHTRNQCFVATEAQKSVRAGS
jgi:hypothetical protein